jgi:hypothetical protein
MRLAVVGILAATCFGASAAAEDALFRFWSHAAVHFPLSPCCTPATYEAKLEMQFIQRCKIISLRGVQTCTSSGVFLRPFASTIIGFTILFWPDSFYRLLARLFSKSQGTAFEEE